MEELQREDVHSRENLWSENQYLMSTKNDLRTLTHTDRIHSRICYASQGRCTDGYWLTASSG
jgi:hypothetical protein